MRQIAAIYARFGDYEVAVKQLITLIDEAEDLDNQYLYNSGRRGLGDIYYKTEEYDKAKEIYFKTLIWADTALTGPVKSNLCRSTRTHLGDIHRIQKEYDKALVFYIGDTTATDILVDRRIIARFGMLQTYLDMNDMEKMIGEYESILADFPQATLERQSNFLFFKGEALIAQQKYKQGIKVLEEYLKKSQKIELHENRAASYKHLYKSNKALGDFEKALVYLEIYKDLEDSLKSGQAVKNVQKIQSDYELSLKESEIKSLEQKQEISDLRLVQQENALALRKQYITILVLAFLALAGLAYLLIRRLQLKKEIEKNEIKKAHEIENLKTQQKAEIAEVKNNLFANISHEFKTPLTLIRVPLQQLKNSASGEDKPAINSIMKNTDYLLEMLDEIFNVAQMEFSQLKLKPSDFNLAALLSRIKLNFAPLFSEKKIQFDWNVQLNRDHFYGDESKLNIVISNLLKNAFSNCNEGAWVKCDINLDESLDIKVSNQGKPIDEKDLPHLFERYYRADNAKYKGTGIGLSWSKQIIELCSGTIDVKNVSEDEVSFNVNIPISNEKGSTLINSNNLNSEQLSNNGISDIDLPIDIFQQDLPHILVVEDNIEMQNLLENVLKADFRLDFAENGQIGEEMAIERQPDLVLSDVMMPEKDGFELLNSLKNNFHSSHIPVVLLTARGDSASRITGLNQDADDYVSKPFDANELKARINNLIRQRLHLHKLYSENPFLYSKEVNCSEIDAEFIDKARQILEKHYSNGEFDVKQFCTELALNRTSVNTKIKALANQTTAEFIKNFRLQRAVKLLVETQLGIAEISMETGFNNQQIFNKAFKKKFMSTPSEYRLAFMK